jgi:hypothetical protein
MVLKRSFDPSQPIRAVVAILTCAALKRMMHSFDLDAKVGTRGLAGTPACRNHAATPSLASPLRQITMAERPSNSLAQLDGLL